MGRPRKNQAKPASKSPPKFVAVRKSSRQIARKQLKDDKTERLNGDLTVTQVNDCSDDSSRSKDDGSVSSVKKTRGAPRKYGGRRRAIHKDKIEVESKIHMEEKLDSPEKDMTESDSQDGLDRSLVIAKKMTAEDVRQMVMGSGDTANGLNALEERTDDQVCWSEDVIEETIICEEMEVEGETMESSRYTLADDGSVVLEEVLLVNEPSFEGKNVVEFTVIRNEDGTESMVESMVVGSGDPDLDTTITNHYEDTSEYHIIEEGVGCLRVNESPITAPAVENSTSETTAACDEENTGKSNETSSPKTYNSDNRAENREKAVTGRGKSAKKNKGIVCSPVDDNPPKGRDDDQPNAQNEDSVVSLIEENGPCKPKIPSGSSTPDESSNSSEIEKSVNNRLSRIDNELRAMMIDEQTKKSCSIEPSDVEDNTSSVSEFPSTCKDFSNAQQSMMNEDEDSAAMSEKSEQSRSEDNFSDNKSSSSPPSKREEECQPADAKDSAKSDTSSRSRKNRSNSISTRSSQSRQKKSNDRPRNIEEVLRDGECDGKADSEDVKSMLSSNSGSGSENSNDTSSSVNNCKLPDAIEGKTTTSGGLNEAEKKIGFRSRSGSTDTTGSESGSNSSAVRRSSRIRTIGLMKQRSRGRGLVTKPNLDVSKMVALQQERERLMNSGVATSNQESRDTADSQSETQSDREGGSSNKMAMSTDSQASSNASLGLAGYESDSSKPVKVKSRWRRSSELEMGSSTLGSRLGFSNLSSLAASAGSSSTAGSDIGSVSSSCTASGSNSSVLAPATNDSEASKDSALNSSPIPRTVGAKIALPMVLEVKDREMEERLSQFEHLRENAYLTERYTNKETKRMVCDCFLTEEEVERGELGCGEDCLNRLLMIECGSRCVVNDRCTNKRFQNCEYAKCEVFRTEKKGFGLRATSDLEAGEFIMEYVGEVLDAKDFRRRAKDYSKDKNRHYYFMALKSDQIIDATMKGNISRFINHSCDPNAETQKWTVNGELRIGFFNRRFVAAGEEITFDYHFQRYGKEAQRCYCEASNCRGWIGDTPEEEKEKIEKKEKREKDVPKKKEEKKPADYMEDEDLEEEIDKLCQCGLKNRAHTLNLSRLMVRSREFEHRTRLLQVIQNGEQPCRRLFLDYHGLRLLWSYMMDVAGNTSDEAQQFRLEVLKTLSTLPIPNKTMLMDSKVYSVVQKWSEERYLSPQRESPVDEQSANKTKVKSEEIEANCDSNEKPNSERIKDTVSGGGVEKETDSKTSEDIKQENLEQPLVSELSTNLLNEWANLKEVFRIPKKERIEQMKEHEREADRGYREDLEKEERRESWYDRPRPDRFGRGDSDKRIDRRRGRDSPDSESYRSKDKRGGDERSNLVPVPRLSKFERRQLFALKVAKEEEERLRRQQQESWQEHEARCLALGIDPHTTATVDPQTGYPLFFNPALGQWQPYPMQDGEIAAQCTPMYGTPGLPAEISPGISQQTVYSAGFPQPAVTYPGLAHQHHHHHHHHHQQQQQQAQAQYPDGNLVQMQNGVTPVPMPVQPVYIDKAAEPQFTATESAVEPIEESPPQPEMPPMDLPPKWKCAKDARGRLYYYHTKERVSQWLPPPPDHIGVQPDSSSSSETSDESSSSNEDEDDQDEDRGNAPTDEDMDCTAAVQPADNVPVKHPAANKLDSRGIVGAGPIPVVSEPKKRRDGLVQERIISPRREEDRIDHKKYKDVKEKMRRQKERARLKEHVDKLRKHRRANKSKTHSRHAIKAQDPTSDITAAAERKIKDTFRINMANVMVHFLNPYRKNDCKQGRITNTEDFKHLARKLTHFVLAKELKHCKSVDELQCNENVKHKAKDFVRKYMNKFGEMYHKSDED